jgi:hypothetical protein
VLRILGKAFGKAGSGVLRFVLALATGMGATRLLLSLGSAFVIASFSFLIEAPLLFRIPFFVGVFILAFVGTGRLLDRLLIR